MSTELRSQDSKAGHGHLYGEMAGRAHRPTSLACSVVASIQPCLKASEDQHTWLPSDPVPVLQHLNTHIHSKAHMHTYMYAFKLLCRLNESPAKFQLLFCCFQSERKHRG